MPLLTPKPKETIIEVTTASSPVLATNHPREKYALLRWSASHVSHLLPMFGSYVAMQPGTYCKVSNAVRGSRIPVNIAHLSILDLRSRCWLKVSVAACRCCCRSRRSQPLRWDYLLLADWPRVPPARMPAGGVVTCSSRSWRFGFPTLPPGRFPQIRRHVCHRAS